MRKTHHMHFRASLRECKALAALAAEEGTTASAILRRLIHAYVRDHGATATHAAGADWSRHEIAPAKRMVADDK